MYISLLILLVLPYLFIIALFIFGWFKIEEVQVKIDLPVFVSILIPVKNESENLQSLVSSLMQQDYPKNQFEVIFIDDHSNDTTAVLIKKAQEDAPQIKLISLTDKMGKKAALWEGIQAAGGSFILTTDGDCRFSSGWIKTMVGWHLKFPGHLLVGPVFFKERGGFLSQFQSLEFLSLIASGAGATGIGRPILCNGANLGARKELFLKGEEIYRSPIASGDDIFLLLNLKRLRIPATFVKSNQAAVVTKNTSNIKQFFDQRSRWTFKSRFYRDFDIIFVALVVLITNVMVFSGLVFSIFIPKIFLTFLLFYLLKCFVDYILLYNVARFFNRRHLLKFFLLHQLLYVFYVSVVGIAGHFATGKWKGRQG